MLVPLRIGGGTKPAWIAGCLVVVLAAGLVVSTWVIRFVARPLHSPATLLAG